MTFHFKLSAVTLLATLAFAGCADRQEAQPVISVRTGTNTTGQATIVPQPVLPTPPTKNDAEYKFDWETDLILPAPPNQPAVPLPWAPNASRTFPVEWANDYKRTDGWELFLNNNSKTSSSSSKILVFYNKFRGVMRLYYYLDSSTSQLPPSGILASTLRLTGSYAAQSSLLNFGGQSIIDLAQNAPFASALEPQPLNRSIWFATQVELAYDPFLREQSAETLLFQWDLANASATGLLGGVPFSTLPVGLRNTGTDFNSPGASLSFSGQAELLVYGAGGIDRLQNAGFGTEGLRRALTDPVNSDLLDGVVTQAAQTAGTALKWKAPAQITRGPLVPVLGPSLPVPGYNNAATKGLAPLYNDAAGVFNLAQPPVVQAQEQPGQTYRYRYSLDVPSVRYLFNPATTSAATIRDVQQTLIAAASDDNSISPQFYAGTTLEATAELRIVGVRVSFEVVPTNGSAPVRIIKTFKPTIVK
ncbi:hypothetical protein [Hymenobacter psychrophilus]|uniref:Uncharacterized protein n=1 Tax=Hymenobacter psychrophilus TaxID=651662 RepID=A0A1H3J0U4_9BACT|nr:hypothetical protein [Hymenobacter psychrophilus]SDY33427.1 hypothetical protein SAMN04488069_107232 [Hymenobacter psychrophilus]